MTSSRSCNQGKNNSGVKSGIARRKNSKLCLKNKSLFYSPKKTNHFEFKIFHPITLLIDTKKKFVIEWKEGEREIYVESTKCKLNKQYIKKCIEKKSNYFKLYLNLSISFHKLRYKADGKIRIYSIYIIEKNNVKDKEEKIFSFNENTNQDLSTESTVISDLKSKRKPNTIINFSFSQKNYCNYLPTKEELRVKAQKKPSNFPTECFLGVNRNHNEIGNKEFLNLKDICVFNSNNDSYKIIDRRDHLLLNHLCQKNFCKKIVNSFTVKYRHKNTTFLYYN
jgi:hypothetical protein